MSSNPPDLQFFRELLLETPDFSFSVEGYALGLCLNQFDFLDKECIELVRKANDLDRTYFGENILEINNHDLDDETRVLYNDFFKAMLSASVSLAENPETDPHELLIQKLLMKFYKIDASSPDYDDYFKNGWHFLASLIECETIAPWLLVCELDTVRDNYSYLGIKVIKHGR